MTEKEDYVLLRVLYISSYAALRLTELMPQTDLVQDLEEVLIIQCEMLSDLVHDRSLSVNNLKKFGKHCLEKIEQAQILDTVNFDHFDDEKE